MLETPTATGPVESPAVQPWRMGWADFVLTRYPWPHHVLKTVQPYLDAVLWGHKTFEVRRDDRGFQPHDLLVLAEWTGAEWGARATFQIITYVLRDGEQFGVQPGFVVLGLRPLKATDVPNYAVGASAPSDPS